ncbi:MAG: ATP-binding protein [Woeseiaceae bacterium]
MTRLHIRFAAFLATLLVVMGGVFYAVESRGSELYHQELTQRINSSIAMYIAGAAPLIVDSAVDRQALATLAERAMVINPTAEIYLLNNEGVVLGSSVGPLSGLRTSVPLAPIQALLSSDPRLPILGADPRMADTEKVFSVSPVMDAGEQVGFVYVILGGAQYAEAVAAVEAGYQQRVIMAAIAITLLAALLIGWGLFRWITRPIGNLTRKVHEFRVGDGPEGLLQVPDSGNELKTLSAAFAQMSQRIVDQVERIRESDRLRRELITNVSHDLRTPLAAMQGYLDTLLIKEQDLDRAGREALLQTARRHAGRLGNLIRDLFELTRLDTGSIAPRFEAFSLAELVNDVAQELGFKAHASSVQLVVEPPSGDTTVIADIALIQRVLENLIDNAIKYTPAGGSVTLTLKEVGTGCTVDVADTGTGIDSDHLPRIFDRHYAVSHEETPNVESTGLGLAIVKKILDLHSSGIVVRSEPKKGTRFRFALSNVAKAA